MSDAGGVHWGTRSMRVLEYLRAYVAEHGYPPSMRQIGDAVGLTSSSSVAHQLTVLEARGYITRDPGKPRAITIRPAEVDPIHAVLTGHLPAWDGTPDHLDLLLERLTS